MSKFQGFLIAIVVSILFITVFNVAIGSFSSNYGRDFDNSSLQNYEKINEINTQMEEVRDALEIKEESSAFDILGAYFRGGFKALGTATRSLDIMVGTDGVLSSVADDLNLGKNTTIFLTTFTLLLIIFIIIITLKAVLRIDI